MSKSPQDVLSQIKDEGIELIDLKFTDIHGKWQHLTLTSDMIEEDSFTEGLAFDGSSIRGWKAINALVVVPTKCISKNLLPRDKWDIAFDGWINEKEIFQIKDLDNQ